MTYTAPEPELDFDIRGKRVWVAGHTGLVGSAIMRRLAGEDCEVVRSTHDELDLTRQAETEAWMRRKRPQAVIVASARVGGIMANSTYPVEFLYDNAMIAMNVIRTAHEIGVEKLLWLGSSCIYPRDSRQPIAEDALLTGPLEQTNEAYAIAKIAGLKLAEAYRREHGDAFVTVMPTNLFGPNDNFDLETAHVLPSLVRKIHEAKVAGRDSVSLWGTGRPLREFLHVDDLADACIFILKHEMGGGPVNVGAGHEISIHDLAKLIARIVGFDGHFAFDTTKPDGTPRKKLDTSRLDATGWYPLIGLEEGIRDLYARWLSTRTAQRWEQSVAG